MVIEFVVRYDIWALIDGDSISIASVSVSEAKILGL